MRKFISAAARPVWQISVLQDSLCLPRQPALEPREVLQQFQYQDELTLDQEGNILGKWEGEVVVEEEKDV